MSRLTARNVMGEEVVFSGDFIGRWGWDTKFFTKNCQKCHNFVGRQEAIRVAETLDANRGKHQWQSPSPGQIKGICYWGAWPKILVSRARGARKCEYFGKPRPHNLVSTAY